ncbi:MAG: dihydrolipoamide acetyltransferase family protein [Candidatus Cohnella colombiensis]|uniref:Dihydrolipoamide acetyltransferase component of pyruvate dehydrogenase complex n=1 Tax=Candidatus Cohnella colombiensis TaxID=3121368 RepID=A0AA95EZN3_9BACL|nr:MAG: dihydrolipoamide acetyltransferase family protein [Cohnella sp.]
MAKQIVEITMPQLAESLVSATLDHWLKEPGDTVDMYEPLCELITDKVNAELPSTERGTIVKHLVGAGETVQVGEPICLIEVEADEVAPTHTDAAGQIEATTPHPQQHSSQRSPSIAASKHDENAPMRNRFSPAVQRLASERGIDLNHVAGTGEGGRITRKDVLAYVPGTTQSSPVPFVTMEPGVAVRSTGIHLSQEPRIPTFETEGHEMGKGRGEYFMDVTPIRNTIASRMRQSVTEIPHAWTMIEVDVTNLVLLRSKLKEDFQRREGINLTYMPFLIKAVVNAIKDYPIMNSVWAVDKIIVKRDINISLAVGTEDSVITPVIRNADQKNVPGLAHELDDLIRKSRTNKISLNDVQGGTFTVNNTGAFGSILSQPIINYPQAAILTFESIVKKPVVINDMIGVRSMVNLCLSLDHRILDGVICGRFLQRVKENLESYNLDTKLY